jgi:lysophospholipase L1-like esterase
MTTDAGVDRAVEHDGGHGDAERAPDAHARREAAPDVDGGRPSIAMPRTSAGAPAFASSSASAFTGPTNASDDDPTTAWSPATLPAWIAYDVSGAAAADRQRVVVAWNAEHAGSYLNATPPTGADMPTDYTIEVNPAPGGTSAPPDGGWVQAATVSNNLRNTVESVVDLAGGNWVRMSITGSTDPGMLAIDVDVFAAPHGDTDAWMMMGDSITYITMGYGFSDLPSLVHAARPDRWPAVIDAAIGGTSTTTAIDALGDTIAGYPGRYLVLAYGTNDQPDTFDMEGLVMKAFAAGKVPVVPLMPWSDTATIQANGPLINAKIQALYTKYPSIVRGPDLWTAFLDRTDLIPSGDIHPNAAGQEVLRKAWAKVMASIP